MVRININYNILNNIKNKNCKSMLLLLLYLFICLFNYKQKYFVQKFLPDYIYTRPNFNPIHFVLSVIFEVMLKKH